MKTLFAAVALATSLTAQAPVAIVSPHVATLRPNAKVRSTETHGGLEAGVPVLGYALGPGPIEIHAILGSASKPQLGPKLPVPRETSRIHLPPREHYALLESSSNEPLRISNPMRAVNGESQLEGIPISGAIAHPDLIAFSPRGEAAALYSAASKLLQVIGNLPARASVIRQFSTESWSGCRRIALTDDGELVIAGLSDAKLVYSSMGGGWAEWFAGYTPRAWSFVPKSHDLVISDAVQPAIVIVSKLNEKPESRILTLDVQADRLGITKDAEQLIAADSVNGKVWTIELKTGVLTPLPSANIELLSCLRDGHTFLLSVSPTLSLLKLTGASSSIAALNH